MTARSTRSHVLPVGTNWEEHGNSRLIHRTWDVLTAHGFLDAPATFIALLAPTAPARRSTSELRGDAKLVKLLREGIDAASDDDGWANLGGVGSYVAKQAPDFDSRNWGYAKLVDLVTAIELFEVKRPAGQGVQVREKPKRQPVKKTAAKRTAARSA